MSRINSVYRRLAKVRQSVQKKSNFDEINISDELRSPDLNDAIRTRIIDQGVEARRSEIQPIVKTDLNIQASLSVSGLLVTSVKNGPDSNLITLEIVEGADPAEAVVTVTKQHISVAVSITEDEETTLETVIEALEEHPVAKELVSVTLGDGDLADFIELSETKPLSGGR
jgi:hypothetical protein